ncbi:MAG: hypothetical protein D6767_07205 [Candidatus Hydrogenedentota bacterium]|nr:MAG: hypothetical protein D6767_07205 [Candidatus Hydrogenedentota bacterium]
MNKNKFTVIIFLVFINSLFAQNKQTAIQFTLGKKQVKIGGQAGFGIEPIRGQKNMYRLTFGATDRVSRQEMIITMEIKSQTWPKQIYSDIRYHNLTVIYKNAEGMNFALMPAVLFAHGKNKHERKQKWLKMSREERLKKGKGVRVNKKMQGSLFQVDANIQYNAQGQPVKITGTFSGLIAAPASPTGKALKIKNGTFELGVMK